MEVDYRCGNRSWLMHLLNIVFVLCSSVYILSNTIPFASRDLPDLDVIECIFLVAQSMLICKYLRLIKSSFADCYHQAP
jgi:uncharacterized membrane protein